jgi:superfamily I DNA/RNA helicase
MPVLESDTQEGGVKGGELNPYQKRAVTTAGHTLILACPGSGKTRVLSVRAARLLASHPKGRLCAVTFTRDAAEELRTRILASCGQDHLRRLAVGTFHSLALAQIKRFGRGQSPRLLSEGERLAVLRRCWKQYAPSFSFDDVVQTIDAVKARLTLAPFTDPSLEALYHGYQEIMESEGAMDFADLLRLSVRRMANGDMPPLPIRWLLVDEAQDMDEVQMEWILLHGRAGAELTLVGDDDQSLYAFRHALGYAGLQEVTFALSATETTLPVNYRCAPNILDHAARLIAHNRNRAPKKIIAYRKDIGDIRVIRAPDRWAEADQIVAAIGQGSQEEEWAILARTNLILDAVELALSDSGKSYIRFGGKSVWAHSIGSVFLGLLRSVLDDSWSGVASALSFCGIHAEGVNEYSRRTSGTCTARLESASTPISEDDDARKLLLRLRRGLASWREQAVKGRPALVAHGVASFLADYCKKPNQANLLRKLEASVARMPGSLPQRLSLLGRTNLRHRKSAVQIMTLHASKGLEFDNVWIMGCEDGNLPHTDSTEEDERRLLYVGMTRARYRLILSSTVEEGLKSRFLEEIGLK